MPRRAIMVDVDGVLIRHPDAGGWSGILAAGLQQVFFKPHWDDVVHGRATLRERLGPVLVELSPSVSCDTLIDYWFSNGAHLDQCLLDELATLREEGVEVHLATVQEHERANYLWENLDPAWNAPTPPLWRMIGTLLPPPKPQLDQPPPSER